MMLAAPILTENGTEIVVALVAALALFAAAWVPVQRTCVISSLGSLTEGDLAGAKLTMQFKAALLRVQD